MPEQSVPLLTDDEIGRLLDACKGNDFDSRRDTAIIRLLLDSGLRVAELIGIKPAAISILIRTLRSSWARVGASVQPHSAIAPGRHSAATSGLERNIP